MAKLSTSKENPVSVNTFGIVYLPILSRCSSTQASTQEDKVSTACFPGDSIRDLLRNCGRNCLCNSGPAYASQSCLAKEQASRKKLKVALTFNIIMPQCSRAMAIANGSVEYQPACQRRTIFGPPSTAYVMNWGRKPFRRFYSQSGGE